VLKDISPWPWVLLPSEDVLLIIFVCKIDIYLDIVIYSTVFSSFDPVFMPLGPAILDFEST
jgi:hypothetical protein